MSLQLGRYEFHDEEKNSHKYWQVKEISPDQILAEWGRIGASPQSISYSHAQAAKKIREKIAKGYVMVSEDGAQQEREKVKQRRAEIKKEQKVERQTDFMELLRKA